MVLGFSTRCLLAKPPFLNCDKQALDNFYENNEPDHDMATEKEREDVLSQSNYMCQSHVQIHYHQRLAL